MNQNTQGLISKILNSQQAAGVILILASIIGVIFANSALANGYFSFLEAKFLKLSVLHWINDALMAIFFLLVGLEVKRELLVGDLGTRQKRILPFAAAFAGVTLPALIYLYFNWHDPLTAPGWAAPAATDIAFALGVLSLVGSRAPISLKIFLMALAVIDDLIVIVIIGLFYTHQLQIVYLLIALIVIAMLAALNLKNHQKSLPYLVLGLLLWWLILNSGIHATLAGVILAFSIPVSSPGVSVQQAQTALSSHTEPLLLRWEHALSNWVSFLIIPIFGFANAGVSFGSFSSEQLFHPVVLGIALGLFFGKQIGIFGTILLMVKSGFAPKPRGAGWLQLYGVSTLCGIGFTMSLFIGMLAFVEAEHQDLAKIGVFIGSILSALIGFCILKFAPNKSSAH
ncbi:Na(+)/H(+) antiporter NhaA [Oligella sp. MSHR50489EDL]|uniref:Na+/H+ antiporter NhaA n=1 Tax=Oligella sp. MSHR50489EDL TaxID=3139409 RepID=UPI003D817DBD